VEEGGEHDRKQERREGSHQIGKAHQQAADDAAEEARGDADHGANRDGDAVGDDADDQRRARPVEEPRQEIAAEQVGTEQEMAARRQRRPLQCQPIEELLVGRERRNQRRGGRRDDHEDDHGKPEHGKRPANQPRRDATEACRRAGCDRRRVGRWRERHGRRSGARRGENGISDAVAMTSGR
jgi:hypothetical protein